MFVIELNTGVENPATITESATALASVYFLRPNLDYAALMTLEGARSSENLSAEVVEQVEIQVKYQGYIDRQNEEIDSRRDIETLKLPEDIDYSKVKGLSAEVQQKLNQHKPETVGQASRISGVTPAAVALLMVHLKRGFKDAK